MNIQEKDILKQLYRKPYINQRELAERSGYSLGMVNRTLKSLENEDYLGNDYILTEKACSFLDQHIPERAVILAAGYGMRMVPINMETPKGLIRVKGEVLIERLIRQLHEADIHEIYVVVGFMKEQFEYLIDDFDVRLVVNSAYASSNNLHSLALVREKIANAYILPCDIFCRENPFSERELYSWYMVKNQKARSPVRVNRKEELIRTENGEDGNPMVGISYIAGEDAALLQNRIGFMSRNPDYDQSFWEEALFEKDRMDIFARVIPGEQVLEINTYEQLRELDSGSEQLQSRAITTACRALQAQPGEIREITILKKGMTNRSFLFTCRDRKYIMRIPDRESDGLVDRQGEAAAYQQLCGRNICDDVIHFDPDSGYKITRYIEHARPCDPENEEDLRRCIGFLREFHEKKLKTNHSFDIFEKIDFYQSLWKGQGSAYRDYEKTRENVYSLRRYIGEHPTEKCLTHMDAVPENFLLYEDADGQKQVRLIDWEYAAMQDPYVDIAMFVISAMYQKEQIDHVIDLYFGGRCTGEDRIKIYCYISACGLMWSNWCEYMRNKGTEFGAYSLYQYRCAKEYYRYAAAAMDI